MATRSLPTKSATGSGRQAATSTGRTGGGGSSGPPAGQTTRIIFETTKTGAVRPKTVITTTATGQTVKVLPSGPRRSGGGGGSRGISPQQARDIVARGLPTPAGFTREEISDLSRGTVTLPAQPAPRVFRPTIRKEIVRTSEQRQPLAGAREAQIRLSKPRIRRDVTREPIVKRTRDFGAELDATSLLLQGTGLEPVVSIDQRIAARQRSEKIRQARLKAFEKRVEQLQLKEEIAAERQQRAEDVFKVVPGLKGEKFAQVAARKVLALPTTLTVGFGEQLLIAGGKIAATAEAATIPEARKLIGPEASINPFKLGRAARETPIEVARTFDPREPEFAANILGITIPSVALGRGRARTVTRQPKKGTVKVKKEVITDIKREGLDFTRTKQVGEFVTRPGRKVTFDVTTQTPKGLDQGRFVTQLKTPDGKIIQAEFGEFKSAAEISQARRFGDQPLTGESEFIRKTEIKSEALFRPDEGFTPTKRKFKEIEGGIVKQRDVPTVKGPKKIQTIDSEIISKVGREVRTRIAEVETGKRGTEIKVFAETRLPKRKDIFTGKKGEFDVGVPGGDLFDFTGTGDIGKPAGDVIIDTVRPTRAKPTKPKVKPVPKPDFDFVSAPKPQFAPDATTFISPLEPKIRGVTAGKSLLDVEIPPSIIPRDVVRTKLPEGTGLGPGIFAPVKSALKIDAIAEPRAEPSLQPRARPRELADVTPRADPFVDTTPDTIGDTIPDVDVLPLISDPVVPDVFRPDFPPRVPKKGLFGFQEFGVGAADIPSLGTVSRRRRARRKKRLTPTLLEAVLGDFEIPKVSTTGPLFTGLEVTRLPRKKKRKVKVVKKVKKSEPKKKRKPKTTLMKRKKTTKKKSKKSKRRK